MKYSSAKDINHLIKELIQQGWHFHRGKKHGRLRPPQGWPTLSIPCTPSDRRALLNLRRDVENIAIRFN